MNSEKATSIKVGDQYCFYNFRDIQDKMSKARGEKCKETFWNWVFTLNNYTEDDMTG